MTNPSSILHVGEIASYDQNVYQKQLHPTNMHDGWWSVVLQRTKHLQSYSKIMKIGIQYKLDPNLYWDTKKMSLFFEKWYNKQHQIKST